MRTKIKLNTIISFNQAAPRGEEAPAQESASPASAAQAEAGVDAAEEPAIKRPRFAGKIII